MNGAAGERAGGRRRGESGDMGKTGLGKGDHEGKGVCMMRGKGIRTRERIRGRGD